MYSYFSAVGIFVSHIIINVEMAKDVILHENCLINY
jgi:hypothetical protein